MYCSAVSQMDQSHLNLKLVLFHHSPVAKFVTFLVWILCLLYSFTVLSLFVKFFPFVILSCFLSMNYAFISCLKCSLHFKQFVFEVWKKIYLSFRTIFDFFYIYFINLERCTFEILDELCRPFMFVIVVCFDLGDRSESPGQNWI